MHQRHPTEISRRRPKNNNKLCIELSESIFSILGDCWEEFICFSLPARLMEEFQASKVYLQLITWLTGKFPADVSPGTFSHFGCGQRTKFRPSVGERGGGHSYPFMGEGKFLTKKLMPDILHIKSQQTPTVKVFPATLSIHRLITSSKSPSQQKLAWRTDILRNRSIGHPWCILWLWKIPEHVLVFLFILILKTVYLQQLFFPLLGFLCSL